MDDDDLYEINLVKGLGKDFGKGPKTHSHSDSFLKSLQDSQVKK